MWDPRKQKYEFETNDPRLADIFLSILPIFNVDLEDIYIASKSLDYSQIKFRVNRDDRLKLEYYFRRLVNLWPLYLMDVDHHESSLELTCEDGYVIY